MTTSFGTNIYLPKKVAVQIDMFYNIFIYF